MCRVRLGNQLGTVYISQIHSSSIAVTVHTGSRFSKTDTYMILIYSDIFPLILFNSLLNCYEEIKFDQCAKYTYVSYHSLVVNWLLQLTLKQCYALGFH